MENRLRLKWPREADGTVGPTSAETRLRLDRMLISEKTHAGTNSTRTPD
jgi:hypothetical protein